VKRICKQTKNEISYETTIKETEKSKKKDDKDIRKGDVRGRRKKRFRWKKTLLMQKEFNT
jgi:hypothetical protein